MPLLGYRAIGDMKHIHMREVSMHMHDDARNKGLDMLSQGIGKQNRNRFTSYIMGGPEDALPSPILRGCCI